MVNFIPWRGPGCVDPLLALAPLAPLAPLVPLVPLTTPGSIFVSVLTSCLIPGETAAGGLLVGGGKTLSRPAVNLIRRKFLDRPNKKQTEKVNDTSPSDFFHFFF